MKEGYITVCVYDQTRIPSRHNLQATLPEARLIPVVGAVNNAGDAISLQGIMPEPAFAELLKRVAALEATLAEAQPVP